MNTTPAFLGVIGGLACSLTMALGEPAPTPSPEPVPAPARAELPPPPLPGEFISADALLTALETADRDIQSLQAEVIYDRTYFLQGDQQVRDGELLFASEPGATPDAPPRRKFLLHFRHNIVDGKQEQDGTTFIFDGERLVEQREVDKNWSRRILARPGAAFDPFRVGGDNDMIPLPIGQRKQDILDRYKVEMLLPDAGLDDPAAQNYREFVKDSYQIRLTPHNPEDRRNDFREIRLWYAKKTLVPLMSRAINRAGDNSIVQLINVRLNESGFPAERITVEPPSAAEGWIINDDPRLPDEGAQP